MHACMRRSAHPTHHAPRRHHPPTCARAAAAGYVSWGLRSPSSLKEKAFKATAAGTIFALGASPVTSEAASHPSIQPAIHETKGGGGSLVCDDGGLHAAVVREAECCRQHNQQLADSCIYVSPQAATRNTHIRCATTLLSRLCHTCTHSHTNAWSHTQALCACCRSHTMLLLTLALGLCLWWFSAMGELMRCLKNGVPLPSLFVAFVGRGCQPRCS